MNRFLDTHTPPDSLRHELTEKEKNTLMIEVHEDEIRVISDYLIKNLDILKSLGIENIEPFSLMGFVEEHPIISVVAVSVVVVVTAGVAGAVIGGAAGASAGLIAGEIVEGAQVGATLGVVAAEDIVLEQAIEVGSDAIR